MNPRIYFPKRSGLRWEVWFKYAGGLPEQPGGATEWRLSGVKFWRMMSAERIASCLQTTWRDGYWEAQNPQIAGDENEG